MTTEIEDRVRSGLASYAAALPEIAPSADSPRPGTSVRGTAGRRRAAWAAAALAGTAAIGGAAAATGVIPSPVRETFEGSGPRDVDVDGAERLSAVPIPGGGRAEFWWAPYEGRSGGCLYLHHVLPEGTDAPERSGWESCGPRPVPGRDELLVLSNVERVRGTSAEGRAPLGTARVVFTLTDGSTQEVVPNQDGWFVAVFGNDRGREVGLVAAVAFSSDGSVIDEQELSTDRPA